MSSQSFKPNRYSKWVDVGSTPAQRRYLNDALGRPIALITQQGAISARTQYDAWG